MINTEPGTTGEKELNNLGSNCDVKQSHENQMINRFCRYHLRDNKNQTNIWALNDDVGRLYDKVSMFKRRQSVITHPSQPVTGR